MTRRLLGSRTLAVLLVATLSSTGIAQTAAPRDDLPDTPGRSDVFAAITAVRPAILACGTGRRGQVVLGLTFASSGSLASVRVVSGSLDGAPIANTPVEQCILTAAAPAHVPPFRHADFSVTYPLAFTGR